MTLLQISQLKKSYADPDGKVSSVIDIPTFELGTDEQIALAGRSGCGKTTFLNLIAGILTPDSGSIRFDGRELVGLSDAKRDRFRAHEIGYVFQSFFLLDGYSALENVLLGMMFGPGVDRKLAVSLLESLGLGSRLHHRPHQLSIGQKQRVALARALAGKPRLVLADEPTGSLDGETAREALDLLRNLCRERGAALLIVSHDDEVLKALDRRIELAEINLAATGALSR
ncbi:MAG: ABC-type lipoprotein export system ATPase subunit [Planctomycetota bacterium]|jgi:ABC-type lipoprotein export system ATPase subunit